MQHPRAALPGPGDPQPERQARHWLPPLLASAEKRLAARGLCARSRAIYLTRIRHLVTTLRRHPGTLGPRDLRDYLGILARRDGLSAATIQQARSILRFLFRDVVNRPDLAESLSRRQERPPPETSPLTREEVLALIGAAPALRDRILIGLLFGSGLRLAEALALRAGDLDPARGTVWVAGGGRGPERVSVLSRRLEPGLRRYLAGRKSDELLFPGAGAAPLSTRAAQRALERAARRSGLWPRGTSRDLRRGFAAELIQAGLHRATARALLGRGGRDPGPGRRSLPPGARSPL